MSSQTNIKANILKPEDYTHGLMLQLGFMKAGFFPIGSVTQLTALSQDFLKSGASQRTAKLFKLTATPEFVVPQLDEKIVTDLAQSVLKGEKDVSTGDLRRSADPVLTELSGLFGLVQTGLTALNGDKPDLTKLAQVVASGQLGVERLLGAVDKVQGNLQQALWHVETSKFIRNDHGVFVSGEWLINPSNAVLETTIRFKVPKPV